MFLLKIFSVLSKEKPIYYSWYQSSSTLQITRFFSNIIFNTTIVSKTG